MREEARTFLPYAALTPLAGSLAFTFDGVYVGATWNAAMRNMMLLALVFYFRPVVVLVPFGNHGLWLAVLGFLLARGSTQAGAYPSLLRRALRDEPGALNKDGRHDWTFPCAFSSPARRLIGFHLARRLMAEGHLSRASTA